MYKDLRFRRNVQAQQLTADIMQEAWNRHMIGAQIMQCGLEQCNDAQQLKGMSCQQYIQQQHVPLMKRKREEDLAERLRKARSRTAVTDMCTDDADIE